MYNIRNWVISRKVRTIHTWVGIFYIPVRVGPSWAKSNGLVGYAAYQYGNYYEPWTRSTPMINQSVQEDYIDKKGTTQLVGGKQPIYTRHREFEGQGVGFDTRCYCKNCYTPKIMHHFRLVSHIPVNPLTTLWKSPFLLFSTTICWLHPQWFRKCASYYIHIQPYIPWQPHENHQFFHHSLLLQWVDYHRKILTGNHGFSHDI